MARHITEGYMPFLGYKTYYRIVQNTEAAEEAERKHKERFPILLLHGGPGSTHNYMEMLDPLSDDGRMVISYDQLGCGNSYVEGRPELWKKETWEQELAALRDYLHLPQVHLLGQSWGGMLEICYLLDCHPEGIRSMILSSTLPSSRLWAREQHRMIRMMPEDEQAAIARAEQTGDYQDPEYQKANAHFMELHCASSTFPEDAPECLRRPKKSGTEAYNTAWGPNEYVPSGTLKDFDYTDRLHEIHVPTLIVSGTNDLCTPLIAKTMYDRIPDSKWELFEGCRHMCFVEDNQKYLAMARSWLEAHDEAAQA